MQQQQQNKGKRKERKVVITIKQQTADGQMVPLNPTLMQAIQSDSKTVFKAQINVDRRHQDFSGNFVNELIKEFNQKNTRQLQEVNGKQIQPQGMSIDPSQIDWADDATPKIRMQATSPTSPMPVRQQPPS
jgi:murein L,D-transpeptidase YcbB/YkuD